MKKNIGYVSCFVILFFTISNWPDPWLALCCGISAGLTIAMLAEDHFKKRKPLGVEDPRIQARVK